MKEGYICGTPYHLLISLVKISYTEKPARIILSNTVQQAKLYQERIERYVPTVEVVIAHDHDIKGNRFSYAPAVKQYAEQLLHDCDKINVFNDWMALPVYMQRTKRPYHLIEDGYNALQHPVSFPQKRHYKRWILEGVSLPHGFSRHCQTIEVNDKKGLRKDRRQKKYIEVPRKTLFEQLNEEQVQQLLAVFGVEKMTIPEHSLLVLTQPLHTDNHVASQEAQLEYYQQAIEPYVANGFTVFLKAHPRDAVDYSTLPVNLISQEIPIELLDFVVNRPFEKGITAFSTALDFLQCIEEKEFLMTFN